MTVETASASAATCEIQIVETVIHPSAKPELGTHRIFPPNGTGIGGALTGLRIGAATAGVAGEEVGERVTVDLVHEDTVQIDVELDGQQLPRLVLLLQQGEVDNDQDDINTRAIAHDGRDLGKGVIQTILPGRVGRVSHAHLVEGDYHRASPGRPQGIHGLTPQGTPLGNSIEAGLDRRVSGLDG